MRVLIAPDKFKDACSAEEAAAAVAAGVRDARPDAEVVLCPLGDGGEGTGRVLARVLGFQERTETVLDPLARPRRARWWLAPDGQTAIVEMAEASGLALLPPGERAALRTTSYGTGQLLRAAVEAGCRYVLLCVGGSATVDGGAGCLQALGVELTDANGAALTEPLTGGRLPEIATARRPDTWRLSIDILCDVDNPLLGSRGAAAVFAPQKGADAAAVQQLERGLGYWADVLQRDFGRDVRDLPGAGAAGGLPAGLAACGARLVPGFDEVAARVGLREKLAACDLCLTGEGRIDEQTAHGKVVAGVARLATAERVPVVALVGAVRMKRGETAAALAHALGVAEIIAITPPGMPLAAALAATRDNLRRMAAEVLARQH